MGSGKKKAVIYIVDDQAMLLDLAEASLPVGAYHIEKFQNPQIALENCRNSRRKPDLLITDFAMECLDGLELIKQCVAAVPGLKTILLSGTMGAEVVSQAAGRVNEFLSKPYQPESLAELVSQLLED